MTDAELENYAKDLELQLVRARRHPLRTASDLLVYRVLSALSSPRSVLSPKTTSRFARSAAKRSPSRSLLLNEPDDATPQDSFVSLKGARPRNPDLPTLIVVTHEASLTGAPILALNLGEALSSRYNVVFITLGPGKLLGAFREASTEVLMTDRQVVRAQVYQDMVKHVMDRDQVAFAVVNSVESSAILPAMKKAGVRVVTLVHEFAGYTPKRDQVFGTIADSSVAMVFSSPLTLENAVETGAITATGAVHVVPQGRCKVPAAPVGEARRTAETEQLLQKLRPTGSEGRFLVMGAGSVELRKGLDLFIECANRLVHGPGGDRFDFVWIGGGYDPTKGYNYSVFLADQIHRSGLETRLRMLSPTNEIETAYRTADLFLLSSRLDPLPNVTVDAMSLGLPIVCFERASGIAPILQDSGLGEACVARYLDTGDLSDKVRALAHDNDLLERVRQRSMEVARARFDFAGYATRIEELALSAAAQTAQTVPSYQ